MNHLPLQRAVLCLDCQEVSDSKTDSCPACAGGSLMPLARVLNPNPSIGKINYMYHGQCDA